MRSFKQVLFSFCGAALLIAFAAVVGIGLRSILGGVHRHENSALSTVMISDATGHGSGVHIGSGLILTAGHVAKHSAAPMITDSLGATQSGSVLWVNSDYDLALVEIEKYDLIRSSLLICHPRLRTGDAIHIVGNPINLKFMSIAGSIASPIARTYKGHWKQAIIGSILIASGMSGGPVFDDRGFIVGIAVGQTLDENSVRDPQGNKIEFKSVAPLALGYIVPSSAACLLLGRNARG